MPKKETEKGHVLQPFHTQMTQASSFLGSLVLPVANFIHEKINEPYFIPHNDRILRIFQPIYDVSSKVNDLLGFGDDSACLFMLCVWMGFILSPIYRFILSPICRYLLPRNTVIKNLWYLSWGLFFCGLNFRWHMLHCVFVAVVAYVVGLILPYSFSSKFTFAFSFLYLLGIHIYRIETNYLGWSLDASTLQMLGTLKIVSVQFNLLDGERVKKLKQKYKDLSGKELTKALGKHMFFGHVENAVERIPNPLEYFAFIFFSPTVLSGPPIEFKDYLDHVQRKEQPSNPLEVLKLAAFGVLNLVLFATIGPKFPTESLANLENATWGMWFWTTWWCAYSYRIKYFIAWYFAESVCVLAGFGYSGMKDGKAQFKKVDQADMPGVELATSIREVVNNWNKNVSMWLRNYAYTRVSDLSNGRRGGLMNMLYTFTISAIWHGTYAGYYMMFVCFAVIAEVHKNWYRKVTTQYLSSKELKGSVWTVKSIVWNVLGWFISLSTLMYFTASFQLLSWERSMAYFRTSYFIGHWIWLCLFVVIMFVIPNPRKRIVLDKK